MFSERPEKYFRYVRIEIADIPDLTRRTMVEKVFTGPIQHQLRDVMAETSMSLNELAKVMGYKGITLKLTKTVDEMLT
ncbi:MAG: hypothetical protein IJ325_11225 [Clostridia bacterium]|nr:hypothetical protein [Clostridia bacterium]